MAYIAPSTRSAGALITAAIWNSDVVANPIALYAGAMSPAGAAAGDDLFMSTTTQIGVGGRQLRQTFKGLRMGTSTSPTLGLTTVQLTALDEWVAQDGTRVVDDLSNPTAVISASGAGGLDTGSEVASTWYEIYRIRRSDTAALALMFHRMKDYLLDTTGSFQTATDANQMLREATSTATDKLAQGVTFGTSGLLESVEFEIAKTNSPTGSVYVSLQASSGGDADGVELARSEVKDVSRWQSARADKTRFVFRTPFSVVATTQYHYVIEGDYTKSDTVNLQIYGVAAGGYAGGVARQYDGSSWSNMTGVGDLWFKSYVTENDVDVAGNLPANYDQYVKLGHVYNNSGSNFSLFAQVGRYVDFLEEHEVVTSVTADAPALTNLSAHIPPGALVLSGGLAAGTANQMMALMSISNFAAGSDAYIVAGATLARSQSTSVYDPQVLFNGFAVEFQAMHAGSGVSTLHVWLTGYRWNDD